VLSTALVESLLSLLDEEELDESELDAGGGGGLLPWACKAAIRLCRKESSLASVLLLDTALLDDSEIALVALVAVLSESSETPSEERISLSAPSKPPPPPPGGGGGGPSPMRTVALEELALLTPLSALRSDKLKLLLERLPMAMMNSRSIALYIDDFSAPPLALHD
jgi:hypothetical protein